MLDVKFFGEDVSLSLLRLNATAARVQYENQVIAFMKERLSTLEFLIKQAQTLGELDLTIDSDQLAFEIEALAIGASWAFQLYADPQVIDKARTAVFQRLGQVTISGAVPRSPVEVKPG
ncbi:MAG: hypothetical protein F6K19_36735 [Cyanothece sp. SIO1E1]|nr:hypothetical protein [Cyanothece sp. SIO1E1]